MTKHLGLSPSVFLRVFFSSTIGDFSKYMRFNAYLPPSSCFFRRMRLPIYAVRLIRVKPTKPDRRFLSYAPTGIYFTIKKNGERPVRFFTLSIAKLPPTPQDKPPSKSSALFFEFSGLSAYTSCIHTQGTFRLPLRLYIFDNATAVSFLAMAFLAVRFPFVPLHSHPFSVLHFRASPLPCAQEFPALVPFSSFS